MTVIWSSVLIVLVILLRERNVALNFFSISGISALYLFCVIRMILPTEFPAFQIIISPRVYNDIYSLWNKVIWQENICIKFGDLFVIIWVVGFVITFFCFQKEYSKSVKWLRTLNQCADEKIQIVFDKVKRTNKKEIRTYIMTGHEVFVPMNV